jgi:hypothetical protein
VGPAAWPHSAAIPAVLATALAREMSVRLVLAQLPFEPLCLPCLFEYPSLDWQDSLSDALQGRLPGGAQWLRVVLEARRDHPLHLGRLG